MSLEYISEKIIDLATREQLVEMIKDLRNGHTELQNKLHEFEDWNTKSEEFEEFQISETQAIVIKNKKNNFFYCPVCFENKKIISLQPLSQTDKICPNCKNNYEFKKCSPGVAPVWNPFGQNQYD